MFNMPLGARVFVFVLFITVLIVSCAKSPSPAECIAQAEQLTNDLQFQQAHKLLVQALNAGETEAHYAVVRSLLAELHWAFNIIHAQDIVPTAQVSRVAKQHAYDVIVNDGNGSYRVKSDPLTTVPLHRIVTIHWIGARVPQFCVAELTEYCNDPQVEHITEARALIKNIQGAIDHAQMVPTMEGVAMQGINREGQNRIGAVSAIETLIENGSIPVGDIPTR